MPKIKIIIADDHKIFLAGLSALLSEIESIDIISTAHNGDEVLKLLDQNIVDLVITDINMPVMDGIRLSREIKKKYPHVKVIALTMHNEGNIISAMLKKGIAGYVLKDAGKEELLEAINTVHKGGTYFTEEIKLNLFQSLIPGKQVKSNSSLIELSEREQQILRLIAEEHTQQQIADKLFISPHTVIFHRRKLLYKFDVKNTAGLIKSAMEAGFLE